MICDNITVKDGVLHFAGQSTVQLAQQYGTPLYLLDEDYIRRQCRVYKAAFARHFGPDEPPALREQGLLLHADLRDHARGGHGHRRRVPGRDLHGAAGGL